ncbi:MAG TPA: amidohydrolase family protein, partial [Exilispira sp.]|nr:amidohydrolase family protein [Exilispira sp.]
NLQKGVPLNKRESISLYEALKSYTYYSHLYSSFPDSGLLSEGYNADMVVLDKNPFYVKNPDDLLTIKPIGLFFKGEKIMI